jgi:hydrogenase maturation factor
LRTDVNNDGYNEVMIGSYGQKVVIYHQNQSSDQMESLCTESKEDTSTSKSTEKTSIIDENSTKEKNTPQTTTTTTTTTTTQTEQIENFSVLCSHQFTYPVFGFVVDDFCRDGTQCVIVSSMFGMHLLQVFGILLFMNDEFN